MIKDHQGLQHDVDSLALATKVTPQTPSVADSLQSRMKAVRDSIAALTGVQYDRAYMASQVTAHQQALDAIQSMASSAQDPAFRDMLQRALGRLRTTLIAPAPSPTAWEARAPDREVAQVVLQRA